MKNGQKTGRSYALLWKGVFETKRNEQELLSLERYAFISPFIWLSHGFIEVLNNVDDNVLKFILGFKASAFQHLSD